MMGFMFFHVWKFIFLKMKYARAKYEKIKSDLFKCSVFVFHFHIDIKRSCLLQYELKLKKKLSFDKANKNQ